MTEKLGVSEKEPAFGQKTPTTNGKYSINSESFFFNMMKVEEEDIQRTYLKREP